MTDLTLDRRRLHRYALQVPIRIDEVGAGVTRDVSASGVLFQIDGPLEPGDTIRFELVLSAHGVRLQCEGRVVRVDATGARPLAAATIDRLDYARGTEH